MSRWALFRPTETQRPLPATCWFNSIVQPIDLLIIAAYLCTTYCKSHPTNDPHPSNTVIGLQSSNGRNNEEELVRMFPNSRLKILKTASCLIERTTSIQCRHHDNAALRIHVRDVIRARVSSSHVTLIMTAVSGQRLARRGRTRRR